MRRVLFVPGVVAVVAVTTVALAGPAGAAPTTTRLSATSAGAPANDTSELPGLTDDCRYATFTSDATNLVPQSPGNFQSDVFVKDRRTGALDLVSVSSQGAEGNRSSGGFISPAPITPDGRFVVFDSDAFNLVPGDTNNLTDVFLRDRTLHTTTRISVSGGGVQSNGSSSVKAISADGRYVMFLSRATNLVANDTNGSATDVFIRDTAAGTTTLVSTRRDGTQVSDDTVGWDISNDGRLVLFSSLGRYTSDDRNPDTDAFVKDLRTGTVERVDLTNAGKDFPGGTDFAPVAMSADGRFVAFNAAPRNQLAQIYVRDRQKKTTTLVSVNVKGRPGDRASFGVSISPNGRFVAFNTTADDMAAPGPQDFAQLYVRDLTAKTTVRASVTSTGLTIPQSTGEAFMCNAGVAFNSFFPDVVPPGNDQEGVYFRSL
jgi:hypothetical protein